MTAATTRTDEPTTHQRLRRAAMALFAERGYLGASMNDIAARIGVRKPSLYNYYPSKEALFLDLLDRSLEAWRQASRPALETDAPFAERLRRHLETAVAFAAENPHEVAICRLAVAQISGAFGERVRRRLSRQQEEYRARLERLFQGTIDRGEAGAGNAAALALAWIAFLDGALFNLAFELGSGDDVRSRLDELWRVVRPSFAPAD